MVNTLLLQTAKSVSAHMVQFCYRSSDVFEFVDGNELWQKMLEDEKLFAEGYHELIDTYNIKFVKQYGERVAEGETSACSKKAVGSNADIGFLVKTPLLIAVIKWIDLATGHQVKENSGR